MKYLVVRPCALYVFESEMQGVFSINKGIIGFWRNTKCVHVCIEWLMEAIKGSCRVAKNWAKVPFLACI